MLLFALEIGDGDDLGIRTGVDISGEAEFAWLCWDEAVDGWGGRKDDIGLGGWVGLTRLLRVMEVALTHSPTIDSRWLPISAL